VGCVAIALTRVIVSASCVRACVRACLLPVITAFVPTYVPACCLLPPSLPGSAEALQSLSPAVPARVFEFVHAAC
jgi:hypothetical protein